MKVLKYIKVLFVVLFIIFEEILWNKIGEPIYNSVKNLKIMERFKEYITSIEHKYLLLFIFMLPVGVDIILSFVFTAVMAKGMIITGIGIYVLKAIASVVMVIIFNTGRTVLTEFFVIKYSYGVILRFKRSKTFRSVKQYTSNIKTQFNVFKTNYLNGDGEFKEEFKKMYKNIKGE